MINDIAGILDLTTEDKLRAAFREFEQEMVKQLLPVEGMLSYTVQSMDPKLNFTHAAALDAWRDTVVKYHMLVTALVEHAKSDCFMLQKDRGNGVTDAVREAHLRGLAAPFKAWQGRLEHMIQGIDNRVNFCKKVITDEQTLTRQNRN